MHHRIIILAIVASAGVASAQVVGQVEDFNSGLGTWGGGGDQSIVATDGVGGAGDGFLEVRRSSPGSLGARNLTSPFVGDLTGAGATGIRFSLRDTGADDSLNIYVGVGGAFDNFWIYNVPATPTDGVWTQYTVPLADDGNWVQIIGVGDLEDAFANSNRLLFRHDGIGFPDQNPDPIAGDFGLDNVVLVPTPGAVAMLGLVGLAGCRRRR